jgi:hypothetical protein
VLLSIVIAVSGLGLTRMEAMSYEFMVQVAARFLLVLFALKTFLAMLFCPTMLVIPIAS